MKEKVEVTADDLRQLFHKSVLTNSETEIRTDGNRKYESNAWTSECYDPDSQTNRQMKLNTMNYDKDEEYEAYNY
jgi:hypothetical protein